MPSRQPMSLAERTVSSVSWNIGANLIKIGVLFARSILLARLLPIEAFGVYTLATAIVTFSGILPNFGMGGAFLHRAPETADEDRAAAVLFTLRCLLTVLWISALVLAAMLFSSGPLRTALIVMALTYGGLFIVDVQRLVRVRRVQHRLLALLDLQTAILTTIVAVVLARRGYGLTALLATDIVTLLLGLVVLYLWRPAWRPRLVWPGTAARYYFRFGSRSMAESALSEALDNVDDIWTGAALGSQALGLYSRAYTFATYPRRILAYPVNVVAGGTYAELKGERLALSQAFFRTNALLVRSGFLLGGGLVLVAPEFIRLALGERWLPMLPAFRLLAVFTLLDPIRVTVSQVFVAMGHVGRVVRVRLVQLAAMLVGLLWVGRLWGIAGVAAVVDVVLLLGLIPLLIMARDIVDFSARRLFGPPLLALLAGVAAGLGASWAVCRAELCPNDWLTGTAKGVAFVALYAAVLYALEGRQLTEMIGRLRLLFARPAHKSP